VETMKSIADFAGSIPVGVFFIDPDAAIILQNATADMILQREPSITSQNNVLTFPAHKSKLRTLIQSALVSPGELCVTSLPRAGDQQALIILAVCTQHPSPIETPTPPCVAIIISDPGLRWVSPYPVLQTLYGFTRAEAELASYLINGDSLAMVARQMETRLNTVRSHLKKVFQKTGTRRQAELVRLLLMTSVLLGASPAELSTRIRLTASTSSE